MSQDINRNTFSGSASGVVVQVGTLNGPLTVGGQVPPPADFSWMLEPRLPELPGREADIEALRAFCAAEDGSSYLWVQAESFAGKSALLKTFAGMPHDGLVLVWFFVRRGFCDGRSEFLEAMLPQLAAVLGEGAPAASGLAAVGAFRSLLTRAAEHCHREHRALVLVVDGLDEEAGAGRDSIVGLLPAHPPKGLRVIVSSRPQRPRPERVTDEPDHPLRRPEVLWPLERSEYAAIVEKEAHEDIEALTRGTDVERRLIGFVTVARGGLTIDDLADLLGVFNDAVREVLDSVTGRCLAGFPSLWRPGPANHRYGFDHDSLWDVTAEKIGRGSLAGFRDDLRAWARRWQREGWPENTPEYLLLNHFGLLKASGDVAGMERLATSPTHQARLRTLTGTDATAIAEIATVRTALLDAPEPDLGALARLAVRHDDLSRRNAEIPPDLPAVWAGLGHVARAQSLIDELPDPRNRVTACAAALRTLGAQADRRAVAQFRAVAETSAAQLDAGGSSAAHAELAQALIAIGDLDEGQALIEQVHPNARTDVYVDLIRAAWAVGDRDRAREACRSTTLPKRHARLVGASALEIAALGRYDEAAHVVSTHIKDLRRRNDALADLVSFTAFRDPGQARTILRRITPHFAYYKIKAETALALALHADGWTGDARSLLGTAEVRLTASMGGESYRDGGIREVMRTWVALDDPDRAVLLADSMQDVTTRGRNLVELVEHLVRADFPDQARALAKRAPAELAAVTPMRRRMDAFVDLIEAVAALGDTGLASAIAAKARAAATQVHPEHRPTVLAAIDLAVASRADPDRRATLIAAQPDRRCRQAALTELALELAETTGCTAALAAVHKVPDPVTQAEVLTTLAAAAADPEESLRLAQAAETAARTAQTDKARSTVRAAVARALLHSGDHELAADVARTIEDRHLRATTQLVIAPKAGPAKALGLAREIDYPYYRVRALADVLRVNDDPQHAGALLDEARSALPAVDPGWQIQACTHLAEAAAATLGLPAAVDLVNEAQALATTMTDLEPDQLNQAEHDKHTQAIHDLATAVARMGWHNRAARIARTLIRDPYRRCRALSQVATITATRGDVGDAEATIRSVRIMARALGNARARERALAAAAEAQAACARTTSIPATAGDSRPPAAVEVSRRALAEQLTTPDWTGALLHLATADPGALRGLAEALPVLYGEADHGR